LAITTIDEGRVVRRTFSTYRGFSALKLLTGFGATWR